MSGNVNHQQPLGWNNVLVKYHENDIGSIIAFCLNHNGYLMNFMEENYLECSNLSKRWVSVAIDLEVPKSEAWLSWRGSALGMEDMTSE